MLDEDGFRPNVGIVIANGTGGVLWASRVRQSGWQFPQGGIQDGEKPDDALYRELHEEVGLQPEDVKVLGATRGWLRYRLPRKMIRQGDGRRCIGQKQKWYLLELRAADSAIHFGASHKPEFDDWRWVSYWYPVTEIIDFKRNVYRRMLKELSAVHSATVARHLARDAREAPGAPEDSTGVPGR